MLKSIFKKLGFGDDDVEEEEAKSEPASSSGLTDADLKKRNAERRASRPTEMPMVDVVSKLEGLAAANPAELSWKVSIVDLLKLLDIDSSYDSRKELATELGCPTEFMDDSAKMNTWLHKTVLQKIAKNGGNIPKELLD